MKKVIVLIACLVFSGSLMAQNDAITKFFSKYAEDEAFTVVTVSSKAFSLFADIDADDPDEKEALEAMSKLEGLRVLALDDSLRAGKVYKEALALIPSKEYEELMTVRHEDQDLKFLIKDSGGTIRWRKPFIRQIEQLQSLASKRAISTRKRTAPQWQPPS